MKKVVFFKVGGILLGVVTILFILMSITTMPNEVNNGFTRNWKSLEELPLLKKVQFEERVSRIAGVSNNSIFLSGETVYFILRLNKSLEKQDTLLIRSNIPPGKMVPYYVSVDTPNLYMHINNMSQVFYGKFPNQRIDICSLSTGIFTKSIQMTSSSMLVRSFDSTLEKQEFVKVDIRTGSILRTNEIIKQEDATAGLSSDGSLRIGDNKVFYIEYFRNKFYCLDTNLNLLYTANTVDTFSTNYIQLVDEDKTDTLEKLVSDKARMNVNKEGFVYKNILMINSGIRSDDQSVRKFNTSTILDMYHVSQGKYLGSLLIGKSNLKFPISMFAFNDTLAALYENEIRLYSLKGVHEIGNGK